MNKEAALQVLEEAMDVERQGQAFYLEAAEHVQDPLGKQVFQTLSKEEIEHLRLLQTEYDAISQDDTWVGVGEAKTRGPQASLKLFPDKRDAAYIVPPDATDLQALQMAMDFEEKGYNMYHKAAAEAGGALAKALFDFLAEQENGHYVFLQKTHEYLTSEGIWYFDEQEFPFFEG
jgi:rubrerythrin